MYKKARKEIIKKMKYSFKRIEYMTVKTGKEKEENVSERVKAGNIQ